MRIIGFNFEKISIEKKSNAFKEVKIKNNIDVSEISKNESHILQGNDIVLGVKFKFSLNYEPDIANINLEGNVLFSVESELAKDILEQWKDKSIPEDFRIVLFNIILKKSNVKALHLEDEMNLPLHIPFPSIKKEQKEMTKK